jgi:outer membrane biosynthesis protein TonB
VVTTELKNNSKAIAWTAGIHLILLLIFFMIKYTLPAEGAGSNEDLMEVNLGTDMDGFGTDQPEDPNDPAAANALMAHIEAGEQATADEPELLTSDEADAPAVVNNRPRTPARRTEPARNHQPTRTNSRTATAATNTSTAPRQQPKYVMPGATGTGGNRAAGTVAGSSEGIGTGTGDMGVPAGTPGAKNYFGTSYRLGNRQMVARPEPTAEFNEGGRVVINVTVSRDGSIKSYRVTKASNPTIRAIAEKKIKSVRFNKSDNAPVEQFGDITFEFKATRAN